MATRKIDHTPRFTRELKKLSKRHHGFSDEVAGTLNDLADDIIKEGDKLTGFEDLPVFKKKIGIGGNIGQRRGARIIYYKDDDNLWALSLYSKNQKGDITDKDIKDIMEALNEYVL